MSLILFGFKASGKTYLGKKLSQILALPFFDLDEGILSLFTKKHSQQLTTPEIYEKLGEEGFRDLEEEVVQNLCCDSFHIISLGGGSLNRQSNVVALQKIGTLVYLKSSFEIVKERIFSKKLPAFLDKNDPLTSLEKLYETRCNLYEKIPSKTLDLTLLSEKEALDTLADLALCYMEGYGI